MNCNYLDPNYKLIYVKRLTKQNCFYEENGEASEPILRQGVLNDDLYKNRIPDHWARNCLDTLCDRGIIQTPQSWTDFEAEVSKGLTMAIFCKTFYK